MQAEKAELTAPAPRTLRTVEGRSGLVISTLSPIAALAGVETLKQGGNAADAAITTALTQITVALGTNISYAGILEVVYYDAKTKRTHALNAGWDTWSGETERATIPDSSTRSVPGRRTLVPGFMAGIEALHSKFGKLSFADLFAPAIGYAERGVAISPLLNGYFAAYSSHLALTPAGRRFLQQSGGAAPKLGARFIQNDLAATLRAVARNGAREMYSGPWAREFVGAVRAAGGKASLEDLKRYRVQWSEPASHAFQGYEIRISPTSAGAQPIREALGLIENSGLANRLPYSNNADALLGLSRILTWVMVSSNVPAALEGLRSSGVDISPAGRLTPEYAKAVAPVLGTLFTAPVAPTTPPASNHSASVVAVDAAGNIAALVHTSNTVAWGSTGLVVGGIPIPEAADLAALRFPTVKPGERIPHDMAPLIAFKGGKPVLAVATIGSSVVQESVRVVLEMLIGGSDVAQALTSPPLLLSTAGSQPGGGPPLLALGVPANAYGPDVLDRLRAQGVNVKVSSPAEVIALRGTAAVARIGGASSGPQTAEVPGIFVFAMGY